MPYSKHFILTIAAASLLAAQAPTRANAADPVVAVIDGKEFKKSDVEALLSIAPPAFLQYYQANPREALGQWMLLRHLADEGRARGIDKRGPLKEQIEWQINEMIARAAATEVENTYPVSTEMIEEYYKAHPDMFGETQYKAIVIEFQAATQGTRTEDLKAIAEGLFKQRRKEDEARIMAEDLVKQLREGADFDTLAAKFSDDADSKAKGGLMPPLKPGSTLPADFRDLVLYLEKGKISDPIRQPSAFYIVRVEDRVLRPIEDLRGDIVMAIRRDHRNAWVTELSRRSTVEIKDESFFQPKAPGAIPAIPGQQ